MRLSFVFFSLVRIFEFSYANFSSTYGMHSSSKASATADLQNKNFRQNQSPIILNLHERNPKCELQKLARSA